jgi:hypothetical protein
VPAYLFQTIPRGCRIGPIRIQARNRQEASEDTAQVLGISNIQTRLLCSLIRYISNENMTCIYLALLLIRKYKSIRKIGLHILKENIFNSGISWGM